MSLADPAQSEPIKQQPTKAIPLWRRYSRLTGPDPAHTSPWDVIPYVAMAIGLLAVSLLSGYIPARRASRIHPMIALRDP